MPPEFKISGLEKRARKLYHRLFRDRITDPLHRQRLRLVWHVFGYAPFLAPATGGNPSALAWTTRMRLVLRFVRVDWAVEHAHYPSEMARICRDLARRPGRPGEIALEAGCWKGGSTAKFSLVCARLGLPLHVYDSFQGVEPLEETPEGEWDFAGQYASPEADVRALVARLGDASVCTFHAGWFADSMADGVPGPIRMAYIDCDLAKGTLEVLAAVVPQLSDDALLYSQDSYIPSVRNALAAPDTWGPLGVSEPPEIEHVAWCTGRLVPTAGRWPTRVG